MKNKTENSKIGKMYCAQIDDETGKVCGEIDDNNNAYCIKHGRSFHKIYGENKTENSTREEKSNELMKKLTKNCKQCKKFSQIGTICPAHQIEIIDTIAKEEGYNQALQDVEKIIDKWLNLERRDGCLNDLLTKSTIDRLKTKLKQLGR